MPDALVELTEDNFAAQAMRQDGVPVLIDFWATWCAPCLEMQPMLETLAQEFEGRVIIAKVNVDEQEAIANAVRIEAVPTLVLVLNGEVRDVLVGRQSLRDLKASVEELTTVAA